MAESLANWFVDVFREKISEEWIIFIISLFPILELRGGLIAAGLLGVPWAKAFAICFVGNMLPVPFILLFIRKIFEVMKRSKAFEKIVIKMEKKAEKNGEKVKKYELLGLFILVAIPLPGTGAWTGALVAALMDIRLKKSIPAIALGVIVAGLIVSALMYGIVGSIIGR
ncbi:MAG: small multi-drug export protein [Clostridia bacterium]|nr:small multi-drug export protein [Clostridia bacterium]